MNVAGCVTVNKLMPDEAYERAWRSIVVDPRLKERFLHAALLAFHIRPKLPPEVTALHGLILLYGPPGTGKTTLARGLAYELASLMSGKKARLVEVNPHGLMSAEHGQSQQKVLELLGDHIPALAGDGIPTVVLLDEVESMAVARSEASLQANPADVHRATDAVLTALDDIARDHPSIVVVATSNFTSALDEAFKSRADAAIEVPLPSAEGIEAILSQTLHDFAAVFPDMAKLADEKGLATVAHRLVGTDGRRVRKLVTEALGRSQDTIRDPNKLTLRELAEAVTEAEQIDRPEVRDAAA